MWRLSLLGRDNCFSPGSELKTQKGQTGFWGSLCSLELLLPIFPFKSDLFILSPDPAVSKHIWLLFKETGSHWAMEEKAVTSRSPCQSPMLQNSLKLQTLGDFLLQVHHLIQQVLELQVIGVHFLLGLQGGRGQRWVGQGGVGQGKAQQATNSEKVKGG